MRLFLLARRSLLRTPGRLKLPRPGTLRYLSDSTPPPVLRLAITFTCTAPDCSHRSSHVFTKASYEKGIVIVQCPSCKNRHLIADHLGWFKDSTGQGKFKTIEEMMAAKGEAITRGQGFLDDESNVVDVSLPDEKKSG